MPYHKENLEGTYLVAAKIQLPEKSAKNTQSKGAPEIAAAFPCPTTKPRQIEPLGLDITGPTPHFWEL